MAGISAVFLGGSVAFAAGGGGRIAVQTTPAGATVYLDGLPSGKSPAAIEGLAPGHYLIRVEMDGFHAAELVVDLGAGQRYESPAIALVPAGTPLPRTAAAPAPPVPTPVAPAPAPTARPGTPPPSTATPTPAPMPAPVTPNPVPAPAAPPSATPAPTAPDGGDSAVQQAVNDYLHAIEDGNVEAYVQLCAPTVEFYEDGAKTQAAIRKIRQQFKQRWPIYKIENVRDPSLKDGDKPGVKRASVTYDWNVSNPKTGKKASGTAIDQLDFREVNGKWLLFRARQSVDRSRH